MRSDERIHNCNEIKEEMENLKKLKSIAKESFICAKSYLSNKSIEESRTLFRIRTNMIEVKVNMKGLCKKDLTCIGCKEKGLDRTAFLPCR